MRPGAILFLVWPLGVLPASAQFSLSNYVLSPAGGAKAGKQFSLISVTGQALGFTPTEGSASAVVSGFQGGPILEPRQDTDGDGLADELDADNDGDSQSDIFEVLAHTGHNDFTSFFSFSAQPVAGSENQVSLVYEPTFPSRSYLVEWSLDLTPGNWIPLLEGETTVSGARRVTKDENTVDPARKFYRLRIELVP